MTAELVTSKKTATVLDLYKPGFECDGKKTKK